jgi:hypothetical protein
MSRSFAATLQGFLDGAREIALASTGKGRSAGVAALAVSAMLAAGASLAPAPAEARSLERTVESIRNDVERNMRRATRPPTASVRIVPGRPGVTINGRKVPDLLGQPPLRRDGSRSWDTFSPSR